MAYEITEYPEQCLICNRYTGTLTGADLLESVRKRETVLLKQKIHILITDFSAVEAFQISSDARNEAQTIIDALAGADQQLSIYFVTPDDAIFGSAQMWQIPIKHRDQVYIKKSGEEIVALIEKTYGTEAAKVAQQWLKGE